MRVPEAALLCHHSVVYLDGWTMVQSMLRAARTRAHNDGVASARIFDECIRVLTRNGREKERAFGAAAAPTRTSERCGEIGSIKAFVEDWDASCAVVIFELRCSDSRMVGG